MARTRVGSRLEGRGLTAWAFPLSPENLIQSRGFRCHLESEPQISTFSPSFSLSPRLGRTAACWTPPPRRCPPSQLRAAPSSRVSHPTSSHRPHWLALPWGRSHPAPAPPISSSTAQASRDTPLRYCCLSAPCCCPCPRQTLPMARGLLSKSQADHGMSLLQTLPRLHLSGSKNESLPWPTRSMRCGVPPTLTSSPMWFKHA